MRHVIQIIQIYITTIDHVFQRCNHVAVFVIGITSRTFVKNFQKAVTANGPVNRPDSHLQSHFDYTFQLSKVDFDVAVLCLTDASRQVHHLATFVTSHRTRLVIETCIEGFKEVMLMMDPHATP